MNAFARTLLLAQGALCSFGLALTNAGDEAAVPAYPVRDGLVAWFDAAQTEADLSKADAAADVEGVPLAAWPDASSNGLTARQENAEFQPRLVQVSDDMVVRFDGVNDHFRVTDIGKELTEATIFLAASPRACSGAYNAFVAANEHGKRDFETGFTIDLGASYETICRRINVEGKGFVVEENLLSTPHAFGTLHIYEVVISPANKTVTLVVDSDKRPKTRPFEPATLKMDELTIGARYYTLGSGDQQVTGYISADIAELLIYDRELTEEERASIRDHMNEKYVELGRKLPATLPAEEGVRLEMVNDPPPVQMFVPGFVAHQLPVTLPNINNIRYRQDGKLVALGYNGDVYLLSDSDGDGLEDKADLFWKNEARIRSPIGMALTPPDYDKGDGLFIATKSECVLITDTDGDDKADSEITVAEGWNESFHNVDALGVAVDPVDHSVYFGLGTANFADPLQRNAEGVPQFRIDGERGTILKVSPDFSSREVFCTGIRFPVSLAVNRLGDLFGTDQEGATWVPNGNPLDELLHIQEGRHYGFPPRHPDYLPSVIDEPSVYDYAPQHQSTCGLTFNDPVLPDGPTFGPAFWDGDAFVCGYSRGKIYRTKLIKTPAGYVADNRIIACLNMLTVDSCVTPAGGMVVSVHSGGPDWGSGPSGEGKLYHITYANREAPQPVATWAAGRNETHIAFDRPLDPASLNGLAAETRITYGENVRAGDEFESIRPGYEVVARQMTAPRYELTVHSAQITPDRQTLILVTDEHSNTAHYAVKLPDFSRPDSNTDAEAANGALPQYSSINVDYSLNGVSATWKTKDSEWSGWLPHLDLSVSRVFTHGSAVHDALYEQLAGPGELTLETQFDLSNMLHPAVQPGSVLDYELPPETVMLRFESPSPFRVLAGGNETDAQQVDGTYWTSVVHQPAEGELLPVTINLSVESGTPQLTATWSTAEDERTRAFPLRRMYLPWAAPPASETIIERTREIPELAGGSWARGHKLFYSEVALCSRCHAVSGAGNAIGPDLSNLIHRDYASVVRDVSNPSFTINPDYIAHSVLLDDGRILTGTLRTVDNQLLISDTEGKVTAVDRDAVDELVPQAKSIMPDGLEKKLQPDQMRDLLTFLLQPPPRMPLDGDREPPPLRTQAELAAVLTGAPDPPEPARPIRIVLVAGEKDHGPGEHDYPAWQNAWSELLSVAPEVSVGTAWEWPSAEDFEQADVLVFYQKGDWTSQRSGDIDAFLKRGGGLVYIHYAVDGGQDAPGFAQRIGLAWQGGRSKFRHGPLDLGFETGQNHPIARNFSQVKLIDESYWNLVGNPSQATVLATAEEEGRPQPLFWTLEPSNGRVFVSIPGHYSWTFDDPLFRVLLLRGIAWSAKEPVDRLNMLAPIGARLQK